ncbi:hypothetical protein [Streptomyces sp. GS7]|uniref:hypothetical protein n=1 Tax=Streptomyces sp. GS7 TaxID=2692234 RepID=UPI0013196B42|nr:hypothetical protein [Streptomyces sp. GS7]QHC23941.1 hypothetical protein GR130_23800 [Streptomyces sp. GS7]
MTAGQAPSAVEFTPTGSIGRAALDGRPVDFFAGGIKNVQVFDQARSADRVAAPA